MYRVTVTNKRTGQKLSDTGNSSRFSETCKDRIICLAYGVWADVQSDDDLTIEVETFADAPARHSIVKSPVSSVRID